MLNQMAVLHMNLKLSYDMPVIQLHVQLWDRKTLLDLCNIEHHEFLLLGTLVALLSQFYFPI